MRVVGILAFALISVTTAAHGAEPLTAPARTARLTIEPARAGHLPWLVFDERSGLPQHTVVDLITDEHGFVWAATQDGAARYDGRTWEAVSLPSRMGSNYPRVMRAAADGGIWFGSFDGGSRPPAGRDLDHHRPGLGPAQQPHPGPARNGGCEGQEPPLDRNRERGRAASGRTARDLRPGPGPAQPGHRRPGRGHGKERGARARGGHRERTRATPRGSLRAGARASPDPRPPHRRHRGERRARGRPGALDHVLRRGHGGARERLVDGARHRVRIA